MIYVIYGCDWMIKTIWKFTYKWVLATKHTRTQVLNHSKGFIYVYVLNTLIAATRGFSQAYHTPKAARSAAFGCIREENFISLIVYDIIAI